MASLSFDSKNHNQMCLNEERETISCNSDQSWSRRDAADYIVKKPAKFNFPVQRERGFA